LLGFHLYTLAKSHQNMLVDLNRRENKA